MKKSLHTDHNIKNLFQKTKHDVELKHETNGRPNLWELAEDIGFNTEVSYADVTSKRQLGRHMEGDHHETVYSCNICDITYDRLDNLNAHIKKYHK